MLSGVGTFLLLLNPSGLYYKSLDKKQIYTIDTSVMSADLHKELLYPHPYHISMSFASHIYHDCCGMNAVCISQGCGVPMIACVHCHYGCGDALM